MSIYKATNTIFSEDTNNTGYNGIGRYRQTQHDYANACATFFSQETKDKTLVAILEAGTGVGKSLGYLVPLLLQSIKSGERVAVATFTRHLQRQLIDDIKSSISLISHHINAPVSFGIRYGSDAYVHTGSIIHQKSLKNDSATKAEIATLDKFITWAEISLDDRHKEHKNSVHTGLIFDFIEQEGLTKLPCGIKHKDICIRSYDSEGDRSCHIRDIEKTKACDVLIVTQHMLMLHAKTGFEILDDERPISTLVIDEADKLSNAAESAFEGAFSINKADGNFSRLAKEHNHFKSAYAAFYSLHDYLIELSTVVKERPFALLTDSEVTKSILHKSASVIKKTNVAMQFTQVKPENISDLRAVTGMITQLNGFNSLVDKQEYGRKHEQLVMPYVKWSDVYEFPSLQIKAINTGLLTAKLFNRNKDDRVPFIKKILYTSATICSSKYDTPKDFRAFKNMIGLSVVGDRVQTTIEKVFHADNYGRISMFLAPDDLPNPLLRQVSQLKFSDRFIKYVVTAAKYATQSPSLIDCHQRTVILCCSFREAKEVSMALREQSLNVFEHQESLSLSEVLSTFNDTKDGILVTPSAWEGFDQRIANLIITRVPYLPIDSITHDKIDFFKGKGFNDDIAKAIVLKKSLFETHRKFSQGMGRLIRKSDDIGRLFIADPRAIKFNAAKWLETQQIVKVSKGSYDINFAIKTNYQHYAWKKACVLTEQGHVININGDIKDTLNSTKK